MTVLPKVTVEAALTSDPLADTPTWTDVSAGLRSGHIKRGRSHELDRMQAGTCSLTFRNDDDRWNPWDTSSPYYGNLLTANQADAETDTAGWNAALNCALVRSTTQAAHGAASFKMTATANGDMASATDSGLSGRAVLPNKSYTALAYFRAVSLPNLTVVGIRWYDSGGIAIGSEVDGGTVVDSTTGWTFNAVTTTSPSNAAFADVVTKIQGAVTTEAHYFDEISLHGGNVLPWSAGGLGGLLQPMVKLRVKAEWNFLTANQASPTTTTGWNPAVNCGLSNGTASGVPALVMTASANGDMASATDSGLSGFPVQPLTTYTARAYFQAVSLPNFCQIGIRWYDSAGTYLTEDDSGVVTDATVGDTLNYKTVTSPSTAAYADVVVKINSAVITEAHRVYEIGLFPGSDSTWSAGGPYYLFTGYVESIEHAWPSNRYAETTITAVDGFKVLALAKAARTTFYDAVIADTPLAYYRLNESGTDEVVSGLVTAADSSGNARDAFYKGSPAGYQRPSPLPTEIGSGAVDLGSARTAAAGYVELPITACPSGTGDFTVEAWVFVRSFNQVIPVDHIWDVFSVGDQAVALSIAADGTLNFAALNGAPSDGGTLSSSVALTIGRWTHVAAVKIGTAGPSAWKLYFDGVEDTGATPVLFGTGNVSLTANDALLGSYEISGVVQGSFDGLISEAAIYSSALSAVRVAAHYAAGYGLATTSLAGDRIDNLLDIAGFPSADRDIAAGQYIMQPVTQPTWDSSPLPLILDYVDSEGYPAAFFFAGDGDATFQDNAHATPSSSATFGDDQVNELNMRNGAGGSPPLRDDLDLWTTVVCQADGGVSQTATDATAAARYTNRTLSRTGMKNADDADCAALAATLLARYKTPTDRIKGLTIHPTGDPANLYPFVLAWEINNRFVYNRHTSPGGGSSMSLNLRTEGVEHEFGPGDWHSTGMAVPT